MHVLMVVDASVQMSCVTVTAGRMRLLHTADLSVQISHPRDISFTSATMVAVYGKTLGVVPVISPYVRTVLI